MEDVIEREESLRGRVCNMELPKSDVRMQIDEVDLVGSARASGKMTPAFSRLISELAAASDWVCQR